MIGQAWLFRLPAPEQASRDQLWRWLVLREVQAEPWETQVALVDRLQHELRSGSGPHQTGSVLPAIYQQRLASNVEHLKYVWFVARVEQYFGCPPSEQVEYLEEQIATLLHWSSLESTAAGGPADSHVEDNAAEDHPPEAGAVRFFAELEQWIGRTEEPLRGRMVHVVQDAVVCWLASGDLAEQPLPVRRALAERIIEQLQYGGPPAQLQREWSVQQQRQLAANSRLLVEAWFHARTDEFFTLPVADRRAYVDQQIELVMQAGVLELLGTVAAEPGGEGPAAGSQMLMFLQLVDQWIERAEPEDQSRLRQLANVVQQRLLWRQLFPPK